MRALFLALTVVACRPTPPANPLVRHDVHCTLRASGATCAARGQECSLGPPLHCYGTDPGKKRREEERKTYETAAEPCTCLCPIDHDKCSEVP